MVAVAQQPTVVIGRVLATVAVLQAVAALAAPSEKRACAIGAIVCGVSAAFYGRMAKSSASERQSLWYWDWFFTTPLLVLKFFLLLKVDGARHWVAVASACALMAASIELGRRAHFAATASGRAALFALACAAFVVVAALLTAKGNIWAHWPLAAFFGLWFVYPIAFWRDRASRGAWYNALDLASKGGLGLFTLASAFFAK